MGTQKKIWDHNIIDGNTGKQQGITGQLLDGNTDIHMEPGIYIYSGNSL
jgi:hypothetical protein